MNQLTYAYDAANKTVCMYSYDNGGNMTVEVVHKLGPNGTPINTTYNRYTYGDSNWTDKLTTYNGQEITYDAIGNPLSYRDGIAMTWKNGRQLDTFTNGTNNVSYGYDSNSVRISKNVDGVEYTYEYLNGMLLYETRGEAKFYYSYDANGTLYSVKYTLTDSSELMAYYYSHNSRGDIVGIYNGDGVLRAQYKYDAWGNVLSVTDKNGNAITSETHIGNLNPFRYRGYYYDTESGFYYLMSRYYDPVTHRFINADGYFQAGNSILDANTFAYCRNNPIMYSDPNGEMVHTIGLSGFICFGLAGYGTIYYAYDDLGNAGFQYSYIDYDQSGGMGIFGGNISITQSTIWDANTIYDLKNNYTNIGIGLGEGLSIGLDLIHLEGYETLSGISTSLGVGAGIDFVHVYNSTTNTIWSYSKDSSPNQSLNNKSTVSNTNKSTTSPSQKKSKQTQCRACGRPIGNKYAWECRNPSYY